MMKKGLLFLGSIVLMGLIIFLAIGSENNEELNDVSPSTEDIKEEGNMSIHIEIEGVSYTVLLEDNDTSKELVEKLPFTLTMSELNGNEFYFYFADSFPNNAISVGEIHTGDLMLYGDDCLVLFYEDFSTSYRYTKIGSVIDADNLKDLAGKESITVVFTK